jgi:DNA topoisomerase-1
VDRGAADGAGSIVPGAKGESVTTGLGLKEAVAEHLGAIDAREINSIPVGVDAEGRSIVVRVGRYGPYLQRGEDRASIPDDLAPDELTVERAEALLDAPSSDRVLGTDPDTGLEVQVRAGRFGPYVQLGPGADGEKPRTASLFKSMSPATVTLDQALELLRLPRVVGTDPASGEQIMAANGRFGPYLKRGADTRSLQSEDQLLTISLEEALALFAQPKTRRGRGQAAEPLRELGPDPATGLPVVVREGRFGPYVTDGSTNASLRKDDDPMTVTIERAAELLAERRAAGPSTRGRSASKKAATKKAATKKAASKRAPTTKRAPTGPEAG